MTHLLPAMQKLSSSVFLFYLIFLILISKALAQNNVDTIRFVVYDTLPYAYTDEKGEVQGTVVDIAKLISAEAKIPFEIYSVRTSRVMRELENGDA